MKYAFAHKFQFFILLIAICWLAFLSWLLQLNEQSAVFSDAENYKDAAALLYHHFKFHFYRPLLMPAIMGLPFVLGYSDQIVYQFGLYVNVGCWIGNALLLYRLLQETLSNRKAFLFTISYILIVGSTLLVFHFLTESLYTFFILAGFYFLMRFYTDKNYRHLAISLSILLLSILIKPGSQIFVFIVLLWHLGIIVKNYENPALIFIAGSLFLIGFQIFEMKKAYGNYTVSYISGVTYYNYLGAKSTAMQNGENFGAEKRKRETAIFTLPVSIQNQVATIDLKNQLANNSVNLIKSYFSNLLENIQTPSDCISICQNVSQKNSFDVTKQFLTWISKWQNRVLSLLGLCLSIYCLSNFRRLNTLYLFVGIYILSVICLSGLSCYQGDRFHVVFYPFVILLTARIYSGRFGSLLK